MAADPCRGRAVARGARRIWLNRLTALGAGRRGTVRTTAAHLDHDSEPTPDRDDRWRRSVVAGPAQPHLRARPHHHARRVRGPRGVDDHADRRGRAERHRAVRLGVHGVHAGLADRHRAGRRADRSPRARRSVRGRHRSVRHRLDHRRSRAIDADPRGRPVPPGSRRRHRAADRVRGDRAQPARALAAADVRDAVDRMGDPGCPRSGPRRHRR